MSPQTDSPDSRESPSPHQPGHDRGRLGPDPPPAEAFRDAFHRLSELKEYASYYAAARFDSIKASLRNVGVYAGLGLMALAGGAALIATAMVLLLVGIAGAFAQLFPNYPWLGDIITAVIFIAIVAGGAVIGLKVLSTTFRSSTVKKYEQRQSRQREQFGHDVGQQARQAERTSR